MSASAERLTLASLLLLLGCSRPSEDEARPQQAASAGREQPARQPEPAAALERVDMHVHLVDDARDELLASMDRLGIARAVVIASPHLDPAHPPATGADKFASWREANDRLLAQTRAQRERLLPFVTIDPAALTPAELDAWLEQGACGVKIYAGHHSLHPRPLDDPANAASFELLERRGVPVLLHVNTVRYEAELDALLRRYPKLSLVCAHLCGARTQLDRLERIMRAHPSLLVDTSHGAGLPGVEGFTNLERERERLRGLIVAEPARFLFGSDLVTLRGPTESATRVDWDRQVAANLGLLAAARFESWRGGARAGSLVPGEYQGLALDDPTLDAVLGGNARAWLAPCLK